MACTSPCEKATMRTPLRIPLQRSQRSYLSLQGQQLLIFPHFQGITCMYTCSRLTFE